MAPVDTFHNFFTHQRRRGELRKKYHHHNNNVMFRALVYYYDDYLFFFNDEKYLIITIIIVICGEEAKNLFLFNGWTAESLLFFFDFVFLFCFPTLINTSSSYCLFLFQ